MEEIDQVGEVDMDFDFAGWVDEDDVSDSVLDDDDADSSGKTSSGPPQKQTSGAESTRTTGIATDAKGTGESKDKEVAAKILATPIESKGKEETAKKSNSSTLVKAASLANLASPKTVQPQSPRASTLSKPVTVSKKPLLGVGKTSPVPAKKISKNPPKRLADDTAADISIAFALDTDVSVTTKLTPKERPQKGAVASRATRLTGKAAGKSVSTPDLSVKTPQPKQATKTASVVSKTSTPSKAVPPSPQKGAKKVTVPTSTTSKGIATSTPAITSTISNSTTLAAKTVAPVKAIISTAPSKPATPTAQQAKVVNVKDKPTTTISSSPKIIPKSDAGSVVTPQSANKALSQPHTKVANSQNASVTAPKLNPTTKAVLQTNAVQPKKASQSPVKPGLTPLKQSNSQPQAQIKTRASASASQTTNKVSQPIVRTNPQATQELKSPKPTVTTVTLGNQTKPTNATTSQSQIKTTDSEATTVKTAQTKVTGSTLTPQLQPLKKGTTKTGSTPMKQGTSITKTNNSGVKNVARTTASTASPQPQQKTNNSQVSTPKTAQSKIIPQQVNKVSTGKPTITQTKQGSNPPKPNATTARTVTQQKTVQSAIGTDPQSQVKTPANSTQTKAEGYKPNDKEVHPNPKSVNTQSKSLAPTPGQNTANPAISRGIPTSQSETTTTVSKTPSAVVSSQTKGVKMSSQNVSSSASSALDTTVVSSQSNTVVTSQESGNVKEVSPKSSSKASQGSASNPQASTQQVKNTHSSDVVHSKSISTDSAVSKQTTNVKFQEETQPKGSLAQTLPFGAPAVWSESVTTVTGANSERSSPATAKPKTVSASSQAMASSRGSKVVSTASRKSSKASTDNTDESKRSERASSPCIAELMATSSSDGKSEDHKDMFFDLDAEDISDEELDGPAVNRSTKKAKSAPQDDSHSQTNDVGSDLSTFMSEPTVTNNAEEKKASSNEPPVKKKKLEGSQNIAAGNPPKAASDLTKASNNQPSADAKTPKTHVKRIVRRFHRSSQTVSRQHKNKLLQCLIRIPSLDSPPKPVQESSVQTEGAAGDEPAIFYKTPLPATVKQDVFDAVAHFDVTQSGKRWLKPQSCTHGICIGQITQGEIDKSLFRENILTKSAYHNIQFNGQDGILDLHFNDEETFFSAMTQLRKTKLGPRHLPVTFAKILTDEQKDSQNPLSFVRATVIFDQNFASSAFLATVKAQVWNKPKVEETFSVHNMPAGVPVDFLKQVFPDAITIEDDEDKDTQFTQHGRRILLGVNRKMGDHIDKLFNQVYINGHCLVITRGRVVADDAPNLKDILEKQKIFTDEDVCLRKLSATPRDINEVQTTKKKSWAEEEGCEVIMQVDNVSNVEKFLTGRSVAWKGPSTVKHLNQCGTFGLTEAVSSEESNPDLSDISDGSDIGEDLDPGFKHMCVDGRGNKTASLSQTKPSVDTFGRTIEIRDKYEAGSKVDDRRRQPGRDDLRHLITGHGRTGPESVNENKNSQDNRSERSWDARSGDVSGSSSLKRHHRYSFETEMALRKREEAKLQAKLTELKQSKSPRDAAKIYAPNDRSRSPSSSQIDSSDRFKRLVEEKLKRLDRGDLGSHSNRNVVRRGGNSDRGHDSKESDRQRDRSNVRSPRRTGSAERGQKRPIQRAGSMERGQNRPIQRAGSMERGQKRPIQRAGSVERRQGRPVRRAGSMDRSQNRPLHKAGSTDRNSRGNTSRVSGLNPTRPQRGGSPTRNLKRTRSPDVTRRRSASPTRGRKRPITKNSQGRLDLRRNPSPPSKSPSAFSGGRRRILGRRSSLSPPRKRQLRTGQSSLSPISIMDDEGDTADRLKDFANSSRIQTLERRDINEQRKPAASAVRQSNNLVAVQAAGSSSVDPSEEISNQEREVLQEFFKHILGDSNIKDNPLDLFTSSSGGSGQKDDKNKPYQQPATSLQSSYQQQSTSQRLPYQQPATSLQSSYQPSTSLQSSHQQQSTNQRLPYQQTATSLQSSYQQQSTNQQHSKASHQMAAPIPPPIPPPVLPPWSVPHQEKISQLETLANQLAEDIQRQQSSSTNNNTANTSQSYTSQPYGSQSISSALSSTMSSFTQPPSGGMWAAPPPMPVPRTAPMGVPTPTPLGVPAPTPMPVPPPSMLNIPPPVHHSMMMPNSRPNPLGFLLGGPTIPTIPQQSPQNPLFQFFQNASGGGNTQQQQQSRTVTQQQQARTLTTVSSSNNISTNVSTQSQQSYSNTTLNKHGTFF